MELFMPIPETVSYSEFREHLASYLDGVVDDSLPLVVKRKNGKKVVVISEEEYNSLDETAYLMSTKANREHLLEALAQDPKTFIKYESVDDLCKDLGIKP
jgi:antitoxin YefM